MNKKGNILKIVVVVICLSAVTIFALVESGTNVGFLQTYKNNFKRNISGICNMLDITLPIEMQLYLDDMSEPTPKPTMMPAIEQKELDKLMEYAQAGEDGIPSGTAELTAKKTEEPSTDKLPTALDGAMNAKFAELDGKMLCVNETKYRAYKPDGELLWEIPIQMQSPQLTVRGNYVLINETGAKKIILYKGEKLVFEASTEGNIVTADLSEKGDVVAVCEKEYFKGQVVVFNKKGKTVFAWDSGAYNILDAAISKKRRVAISLLNTDEGADSFVLCKGTDGSDKFKTENFTDSIIFDLEYTGESLNAVSESRCIGINRSGKVSWEYSFDGKLLTNYRIAKSGYKMLLFERGGTGEIIVLSARGKAYKPIKTESMPNSISIKANTLAYNSGRDIVMTDFNGKKNLRAVASSDIKQLYALGSKHAFCVYSSSIQQKKAVRQKKQETVSVVTPSPENQGGN